MLRHLGWMILLIVLTCLPRVGSAVTYDDRPAAGNAPDDARMEWWREARFGLFLHWGLYAVPAGQWNGQTNHAEWIMTTAGIPVEQYEKFVDQFNPVKFDADAWCQMAKDAGMKYVVITTKHHDGFCMFDSAQTDYDIMATPFKRDVMAEMATAARRHGLKICWYHSILDWHNPDYRSKENFDRFVDTLRAQVTELLTNYGDIGVMWFDGEWEPVWTHSQGKALYDLCRRLQPDIIVNNRVDKGREGMAGLTKAGEFVGDFGTPEQEVPTQGIPGVDWESCVTMNNHWGYCKADHDFKSTTELVRMLVDIVSKGGNFLLNVGPTAQGEFPPESVQRLAEIGKWMRVNGESIYATTASPFESLPWGRCTIKQDETKITGQSTMYLHVFDWPRSGELYLDGLSNDVIAATLLADPARLVTTRREDGRLAISVGRQCPDDTCAVLRLTLSGAPQVVIPPQIDAIADVFTDTLDVSLSHYEGRYEARYTIDGYDPRADSTLYHGQPIRLWTSATVSVRLFEAGQPVSGVRQREFKRVTPIAAVKPAGPLENGLQCEMFEGTWDTLPDFEALDPVRRWTTKTIGLADVAAHKEYYGLRLRGLINVDADGIYEFTLHSDDGARLRIDGREVIDLDGLHATQSRKGLVGLARGLHWIEIEYFNKTGDSSLGLAVGLIGARAVPVPDEVLWHEVNQ